ncbi:MAG: hypothetical protein KDD60_01775 [Bdellovibrionales bacterium]|nr:hypothetical protein [Bdellovibrionales bacterium]
MNDHPVLVSINEEPFETSIADLLVEWQFTPVHFVGSDEAWDVLSGEVPPEIFLFEWTSEPSESILFLESIWETRHEFPFHAVVFGRSEEREEMTRFLGDGAHDFFEFPCDINLLRGKLEVARQIVVDRRTLAESAQVMERYARFADRVSTERARQLFHAERLSTLGTMSAGLAHEINTPLGYISTSLETATIYWGQALETLNALHGGGAGEEVDPNVVAKITDRVPKAFERIRTGLERIDKLMKGLKNFARASQGEKQPTDLNDCIEVALEMCGTSLQYHVEVERKLELEIPEVMIDPQQVEQVLINLLVNASHALEGEKDARVILTTRYDDEYVEVSVADNGPGIPPSKLETIWQPYYTTKEEGKGTGLGLAISRSLIRDNGGSISVRNRSSGGAEFTLKFPRNAVQEERACAEEGDNTGG